MGFSSIAHKTSYKSNHHIDYFFVWNRGNDNEAFEQFRAFIELKITEFNG